MRVRGHVLARVLVLTLSPHVHHARGEQRHANALKRAFFSFFAVLCQLLRARGHVLALALVLVLTPAHLVHMPTVVLRSINQR